jgi:hypothetical protein
LELLAGPASVLITIILFLLALSSLLFWLLGLATVPSAATMVLLAGPTSAILGLLLVTLLVLLLLLFGKLLYLPALLEIVALGAVDLAVRPAGLAGLLTCCSLPASIAPGNLLAGDVCLRLLGGIGVAGALDGQYCLFLALSVTLFALLLWG